MKDIRRILERVRDLPPAPIVMSQVVRMVDEPDVGAAELVKVIEKDVGVVANLLRVCNTPQYAGTRRVATLQEAINRLGTRTLLQLVVLGETHSFLKQELKGYGYSSGDLWWHSLGVAEASRLLAQAIHHENAALAFTGGLLHDLGKIVLDVFLAGEQREIRRLISEGASLSEAESLVLGVEHAELGARVAEHWQFPESLCGTIRFHHQPFAAPNGVDLAALVHLGDALTHWLGIGLGGPGLASQFDPRVLDHLGIESGEVDRLLILLSERIDQSNSELAA